MHHYVYRVSFGNSFYIGVRSSKKPPEEDTKYLGSGIFILFKIKYNSPVKVILSTHPSREAAEREESRLLVLHVGKGACMNRKKSRCRKYANV